MPSLLDLKKTSKNVADTTFKQRKDSRLPLLRTLLAISQKLQEPNFWQVIDTFVLIV